MDQQRTPVISVIMGIYNQYNSRYLEQAVFSVLRQTYTNFEFIIYDDGSDADIRRQLEQYAALDHRIRLLGETQNRGLAYSLNECIHHAKGRYLARMDDDDISEPDRLKVQFEFMESHPDVPFVGCSAMLIDQDGPWGVRRMPEHPSKRDFMRFSPYIHPTVMIRRSVFDTQMAYQSAAGTLRCEDYELFMRFKKAGICGYNMPDILFRYREDKRSYQRRKFCYRLDETRLRFRNFHDMGWLFPWGILYAVRPMAAACVPGGLLHRIKKLSHRRECLEMAEGSAETAADRLRRPESRAAKVAE